jgi:hypothetical protein
MQQIENLATDVRTAITAAGYGDFDVTTSTTDDPLVQRIKIRGMRNDRRWGMAISFHEEALRYFDESKWSQSLGQIVDALNRTWRTHEQNQL